MEDKLTNKKKKGVFRWITKKLIKRFFAFLLIIFFSLSLTIYYLPSTKFFKEFAGKKISQILKNELNAKVKIKDIYFGRLGYVELDQVDMTLDGDTIAYIPNLQIDVDILRLLDNTIKVKSIVLQSPYFRIWRGRDSIWNSTKIVKIKQDTNSSSSTPFISVNELIIKNGDFKYCDSLANINLKDNKFNYSKFNLTKLNISLDTRIDLDDYTLEVESLDLNFMEAYSEINVKSFEIKDLLLNDGFSSADNLFLNINNSVIKLDEFNINRFNPLNPDFVEFENALIKTNILADSFNLALSNYFVEEDFFEDNMVKLESEVDSKNNLHFFNNSRLEFGESQINFDTELSNLFSGDINLSGNIVNSEILNKDLLNITKNFTDFETNYNNIKINKIKIKSDLKDYDISFESYFDKCKIIGNAGLSIESEEYNLNVTFNNLNLNKILDDGIYSNLNGRIRSKGKSYDLKTMENNLALTLFNSEYDIINIDSLNTKLKLSENNIYIDTLVLGSNSDLVLEGDIYLNEIDDLNYNLELELNKFDLSNYIDSLNIIFDTKVNLSGSGIDLNNSSLNITSSKNLDFNMDKISLNDIKFNLSVDNSLNKKLIELKSNHFDLSSQGYFFYDSLAYLFNNISKQINNDIDFAIKSCLDSSISLDTTEFIKNPITELSLNVDIKNNELIRDLTGLEIIDKLIFKSNLKSDYTSIYFNTMFKDQSKITIQESFDKYIVSNSLLELTYLIDSLNTNHQISNLTFNSKAENISRAYNELNNLNLSLNKNNTDISFLFSANVNNSIDAELEFNINFIDTVSNLNIDKLYINYEDLLVLKNARDLYFELSNSFIDFIDVNLTTNKTQDISIRGLYNFDTQSFLDLDLQLNNFDLREINKLYPNVYLNTLAGDIRYLNLLLNGTLDKPQAIFSLDAYNISYNDVLLGHFNTEFNYNNKLLYGDLYLFNYKLGTNLSLQVPEFPIDLSFSNNETKMGNKETEMYLDITKFPLKAAEPFVVGLKNLSGNLNSSVKIIGNIDDGLKFSGDLKIPNSSFTVEQTNIEYNADADIFISNDKIELTSVNLFNREKDLKNGKAILNGYLTLDNFEPDEFDFNIKSNKIKVLSEKTKYSMPNIYGDLIIATGKRSLFLKGNFDQKIIGGDLIVRKANLNMLDNKEAILIEKKINYIFKHDLEDPTLKEEKIQNTLGPKKQSSFEQNLAYDLNLKFNNSVNINADISDIRLNIDLNTDGLTYVADYGEEPQLIGDVVILGEEQLGNSRLTFWGKTLTASGRVSFPTGNITNPTLDIVSQYEGVTKNEIPFVVKILVSGTAEQPVIEFGYIYDNQEFTEQTDDNKRDAMALLIFNSRLSDLASGADRLDLGKESSDIANALLSNLLSRNLSESLGLNASVNLDLNNLNQSDIIIGDDLFEGRLKWQVGGTPANPQNNEISIILPLSILNENKNLKNLNFEISKPNNPLATRENQKQWEVSLSFKKNW